jgi:hypothetical protein
MDEQEQKEEIIPPRLLYEPILPSQMSVYVTVLNIIQCIALAFLLNEFRLLIIGEKEFLWLWSLRSIIALVVILVVWHSYVVESLYLWPIGWFDTLIPFSIGITECVMVFSTNPSIETGGVSFVFFVLWIFAIQVLGVAAYWNALSKRNKDEIERLYQSVYPMKPEFAIYLLQFLKRFDSNNILALLIFAFISLVFMVVVSFHRKPIYELIFFLVFLAETLGWKTMLDLLTSLKRDKQLGPYFSQERRTK